MHAFCAVAKLSRRLRTAQHQFAEDGQFRPSEVEFLRDAMPVLGDAASCAGDAKQQTLVAKGGESVLDGPFVIMNRRIAVRLLIAGVDERVERERIVLGCSDLFLEQRAEDSYLGGIEQQVHHSSLARG